MKILITENQLEKVIQHYITNQMKKFNESDWTDVDRERNLVKYWTTGRDERMVKLVQFEKVIVNYSFCEEISDVFGRGTYDISISLRKWFFENCKYNFHKKVVVEMFL